jgi:hypothetical protein
MDVKELSKKFNIEVVNIGIRCKVCGSTWGFKVEDLKNLDDIPLYRMTCINCSKQTIKSKVNEK